MDYYIPNFDNEPLTIFNNIFLTIICASQTRILLLINLVTPQGINQIFDHLEFGRVVLRLKITNQIFPKICLMFD